jgi:hypothetical protein
MKPRTLDGQIRIRKATESDVPFLFSSWLKSYRQSRFAQDLHTTIYFSEHHKVLESILKSCEVLVACPHDDISQILGWACYEKVQGQFVLHYIYTKQTYRMLGIATQVLAATGHDTSLAGMYSHHSPVAIKLASKYNFVYNPYVGLTSEYRPRLEAKSKFEHVPEDAFVEKPEDLMNNSPFKKES